MGIYLLVAALVLLVCVLVMKSGGWSGGGTVEIDVDDFEGGDDD